jgi:hypothetical protein
LINRLGLAEGCSDLACCRRRLGLLWVNAPLLEIKSESLTLDKIADL